LVTRAGTAEGRTQPRNGVVPLARRFPMSEMNPSRRLERGRKQLGRATATRRCGRARRSAPSPAVQLYARTAWSTTADERSGLPARLVRAPRVPEGRSVRDGRERAVPPRKRVTGRATHISQRVGSPDSTGDRIPAACPDDHDGDSQRRYGAPEAAATRRAPTVAAEVLGDRCLD
jgi:hypothetical protein